MSKGNTPTIDQLKVKTWKEFVFFFTVVTNCKVEPADVDRLQMSLAQPISDSNVTFKIFPSKKFKNRHVLG